MSEEDVVLRKPELNDDDKLSAEGSAAFLGSTGKSEGHAPNGRLMLVTVGVDLNLTVL